MSYKVLGEKISICGFIPIINKWREERASFTAESWLLIMGNVEESVGAESPPSETIIRNDRIKQEASTATNFSRERAGYLDGLTVPSSSDCYSLQGEIHNTQWRNWTAILTRWSVRMVGLCVSPDVIPHGGHTIPVLAFCLENTELGL